MNQKGFAPILVLFLAVLIIGIGAGGYLFVSQKNPKPDLTRNPQITIPLKNNPTQPTNSASPQSINDGKIVLLESDGTSIFDTSTMTKQQLDIGSWNKVVSIHDGKKLLFGSTETLFIYDLLTNKGITLPNLTPNPRVDSINHISPNDQFFVMTQSCCPGDVGRTIMTIDGKVIKQLTGGAIAWSPDSSTLAISKGEYLLNLPLGPQPENSSIYSEKINDSNIKEKLLIKATNQASFRPVEWKDDHTLIYKKIYYSKPFPKDLDPNNQSENDEYMKVYESPTTSYISIDTNTLQSQEIIYKERSYDKASYSPSGKWKVYVNTDQSIVGEVYISSADGSSKIKISDHAYPFWIATHVNSR